MSLMKINKYINYWWFRYLMVTEMYMVEKWEVFTIHALGLVLFMLFWWFNYSVVLSFVDRLVGIPSYLAGYTTSENQFTPERNLS